MQTTSRVVMAIGVGFAFAFLIAGCSPAVGPVPTKTTSIRGRVLLDGRPLPIGWLEMIPIEGTIGPLRSAVVQPDGTFTADRVPVGRHAVRLAGRPPDRTGDPNIDAFLSLVMRSNLLRITATEDPNQGIDVNLRDEMYALNRMMRPKP